MARSESPAAEGGPLAPALELFLAHLRVEKGLARNSVESYGRDVRRYLAFLSAAGRSCWDDVTRQDVQAHLGALARDGIAPRSQARALSAIRGLHRLLLSERVAGADPTDEVDAPRRTRKLPQLLSRDEVDRLKQKYPRRIVEQLFPGGYPSVPPTFRAAIEAGMAVNTAEKRGTLFG